MNCARDEQAIRDKKFEVPGSKFRKPRTSDLEPLSISPVPLVSQVSRAMLLQRATRYNSMRLFALSIRPLWHGVCVLAGIMAQGQTTFVALIAIGVILIVSHQVSAQQSTAPPSSLSTKPLAPGTTESEIRTSCDLCRKPEGRSGSDLRPQRLRREKGLRPHRNAKGTHRSFDQSLKATLPRRPLPLPEGQGQRGSQTREPAE